MLTEYGEIMVTAQHERSSKTWVCILLVLGGVVFVGLVISVASPAHILINIDPSQRGVVTSAFRTAGYREEVLGPGLHLLPPGEKVIRYDLTDQKITFAAGKKHAPGAITSATESGNSVELELELIYTLEPEQLLDLHVAWQQRYENALIYPAVRGVARDVLQTYTSGEIYHEQDRIAREIFNGLQPVLVENAVQLKTVDVLQITQGE